MQRQFFIAQSSIPETSESVLDFVDAATMERVHSHRLLLPLMSCAFVGGYSEQHLVL